MEIVEAGVSQKPNDEEACRCIYDTDVYWKNDDLEVY